MRPRPPASKIVSREELVARFGSGRTGAVVFANGCFDLLHPGHVGYLYGARALGDALVVAVNSDASAGRLAKGPGRPLRGESDRALMVAALGCVDAVCLFGEDTPAELIGELLPDVLVKGADYARDEVAGREAVEAAGGRVELIPLVESYSTTDLLRRIREESA